MPPFSLFSKILSGEIPSHKVYEDHKVLAFLDIYPLSKGHTLVVPKEEVAYLHELSEDAAMVLGRALRIVARGVLEATGCEAYNVLQNNQSLAHQAIFHVHFHIIPKPSLEEGLGLRWNPIKSMDGSALEACAAQIKAKVDRLL